MTKKDNLFSGFSPETVDFLWGIRMNNNREWFTEHKGQYVTTLYEPMKALGAHICGLFEDRPGDLVKVSRIYRDARLHHPLPYKESLWICVRKDVEWWGDNPCLFFEINPEGIDYGFFFWKPRPAAMKAFRKNIADRPDQFLDLIRKTEKDAGRQIGAKTYARPEKCDDSRLERFFLWKDMLDCTRHEDFSEDVFSPELARRVTDYFEKLLPLYEYFSALAGAQA